MAKRNSFGDHKSALQGDTKQWHSLLLHTALDLAKLGLLSDCWCLWHTYFSDLEGGRIFNLTCVPVLANISSEVGGGVTVLFTINLRLRTAASCPASELMPKLLLPPSSKPFQMLQVEKLHDCTNKSPYLRCQNEKSDMLSFCWGPKGWKKLWQKTNYRSILSKTNKTQKDGNRRLIFPHRWGSSLVKCKFANVLHS